MSKLTCLYDQHCQLNAKMVDFAGFMMPLQYSSIVDEHQSVRLGVGMFDVSHMGEFVVRGKDATRFIEFVFTNKIGEDGRVVYGMFCDEEGKVLDDLFVYKLSNEEYFLVVNAANTDKDFAHLSKYRDQFAIELINVSDSFGEIALQGPLAVNIVKNWGLANLKFMHFAKMRIDGLEFIVSRSGYTGEDGFEFYGSNHAIEKLWDIFSSLDVTPCGLGCRDTLRFEAALPLYGHEMSDTINPFEAGMGFAVKLDKDIFIGKEALAKQKNELKRKVVGLELLEKNIARADYPVLKDGKVIGHITTGYLSPSLNKPIALAILDIEYCQLGEIVEVSIRHKEIKAKVVEKPFYQKKYKK